MRSIPGCGACPPVCAVLVDIGSGFPWLQPFSFAPWEALLRIASGKPTQLSIGTFVEGMWATDWAGIPLAASNADSLDGVNCRTLAFG